MIRPSWAVVVPPPLKMFPNTSDWVAKAPEAFQAKNPSATAQLEAYAQADELLKRNLHWIPPTPVLGKILDRVGYWGTLPLTEGKSYEEVLKSADEEVNAILAEANK